MLIQGGTIVNYDGRFQGDIRVKDGIITELGERLDPETGEDIVHAEGCRVMPGGIDAHTHFDMPAAECMTSDDFNTGTAAAVAGGTTTIIDFAEPEAGAPLRQGLAGWHRKVDGKAWCDYSFHMTVSNWNDNTTAQIKEMIENGITSFKAYTAYKDSLGVEDFKLRKIMECCKRNGGILCVHCEDGDALEALQAELKDKNPTDIRNHPRSRPNKVEADAIYKVIKMAEETGTTVYIVHISTAQGLKQVSETKKRQVRVYGETCPHYLLLNEEKYALPGFESAKYVMSPPLRSRKDQEALWQGLAGGTVDVVSTDHCSFNYKGQKELGIEDFTKIPNGIPSTEHRLVLMHHYGMLKGIPAEQIVALTSYNPAQIFGLYPQKGKIRVGGDADIVMMKKVPPYQIQAVNQKQHVDYTPYEGVWVEQKVEAVYLRGQLVYDGQYILGEPGGKFISRKPDVKGDLECRQSF